MGLLAGFLWDYWPVPSGVIGWFFFDAIGWFSIGLLAGSLWGYWLVLCGAIDWFSVGLLACSL